MNYMIELSYEELISLLVMANTTIGAMQDIAPNHKEVKYRFKTHNLFSKSEINTLHAFVQKLRDSYITSYEN